MDTTCDNLLGRELRSGKMLLGLNHAYPAEGILETIGHGWDFVWIDAQHGQFDPAAARAAVRVAESMQLHTVLRVPSHDVGWLGFYADTGAAAIMIPQVDSREAAESIVKALRFPPTGRRSFGGRRAVDVHGPTYYRRREPLIIVQIESMEGLAKMDQIAGVEGMDGLFFGADDMKLCMGIPVETPTDECKELLQARRAMAMAAKRAGRFCGCGVVPTNQILSLRNEGYQLVAIGGDVRFLRDGSRKALDDGRKVLASMQT